MSSIATPRGVGGSGRPPVFPGMMKQQPVDSSLPLLLDENSANFSPRNPMLNSPRNALALGPSPRRPRGVAPGVPGKRTLRKTSTGFLGSLPPAEAIDHGALPCPACAVFCRTRNYVDPPLAMISGASALPPREDSAGEAGDASVSGSSESAQLQALRLENEQLREARQSTDLPLP